MAVRMQTQIGLGENANGEAMKTVYDDLTDLLGEYVSGAVVRGLVRYALKHSPVKLVELEQKGYPREFIQQMRYAIDVFVTDPGLRERCRDQLEILPRLPPVTLRSESRH